MEVMYQANLDGLLQVLQHQANYGTMQEGGGRTSLSMVSQPGGRLVTRTSAGTISSHSSRERESYVPGVRVDFAVTAIPALGGYILKSYIRVIRRCATCMMGMMGVFKWLRKDTLKRERNRWSSSLESPGLNNEAYRNALQAFIERRRTPSGSSLSPEKQKIDIFLKNIKNNRRDCYTIPGVPHVQAPDVFEIGWVPGTEDRYLELIFAEWQNTRVSLKRHTHPECQDAVKADLEVLTEIRHPNVLLLMATTQTDDHGLVAIFESVDCTLYNYMHEQGERISIQGAAKCAGRLADALRHAHMRGYIHGALSSHCVYLASGNVKLGGWELAINEDNTRPDRMFEERLRAEIFKWKPPDMFSGQPPSKASDVYGLALLIWEMCTGNIPWNNLTEPEVERQYVHWERGVIIDLYNFPPLLNNLLEAGLQIDVTKRTLDMNRMRRFLQRLEIQYEDEEPIYIDDFTNSKIHQGKIISAPVSTSPVTNATTVPKYTTAETPKSSKPKRLFDSDKIYYNRTVRSASKKDVYAERVNVFDDNKNQKQKPADQGGKNTNMFLETQKNNNETHIPKCTIVDPLREENVYTRVSRQSRFMDKLGKAETKVDEPKPVVTSENSASCSTHTEDSTDDESTDDAYTNLKKLKEVIASRRENFFYGSDTSHASVPDISPKTKSRILTKAKGQDYKPHKPASHFTSLEPKLNKSPLQYDPTLIKPASHQNQRSPYSNVPANIRDAVLQPQVLNPDSQSFFESSLWRKEKSICLSKMGNVNHNQHLTSDKEKPEGQFESPKSDNTYTIRGENEGNRTKIIIRGSSLEKLNHDSEGSSSEYSIPRSKSLQALKDALDRATDIVRSVTPNTEDSTDSEHFSPEKTFSHSDLALHNTDLNESIFEYLNQLKSGNNAIDEEIKSIERSTDTDKTYSIVNDAKRENVEHEKMRTNESKFQSKSTARRKYTYVLVDPVYNNPYESIVENSLYNYPTTNSRTSPGTNISEMSDKVELSSQMIGESTFNAGLPVGNEKCQKSENEKNQAKEKNGAPNVTLMLLGDKSRDKGCRSCRHKNILARRRSLPAALGHLKPFGTNLSLGKLPIRRVELPDSTVEDLYIDDEFDDSLNVNMLLLGESLQLDEDDFLPDLLELSESYIYS